MRYDLKQNMRQILLLFVSGDDLKHNMAQILLLFVRCDGLEQNFSGIVLESGRANGRRNLFFGAGPEKPNFFCHRNARAHFHLPCVTILSRICGKSCFCSSAVTILSRIRPKSCFCSSCVTVLSRIYLELCLNPAGPTAEEIYFSGRDPKNQISSAIATPAHIFVRRSSIRMGQCGRAKAGENVHRRGCRPCEVPRGCILRADGVPGRGRCRGPRHG